VQTYDVGSRGFVLFFSTLATHDRPRRSDVRASESVCAASPERHLEAVPAVFVCDRDAKLGARFTAFWHRRGRVSCD